MVRLIGLGMCDGFPDSRESLVRKARAFLNRNAPTARSVQHTLFSMGEEEPTEKVEEDRAWEEASRGETGPSLENELESLRFAVHGTPLEMLSESLPESWLPGGIDDDRPTLAVGWVHEFDLFASPDEEAPWATFLLFGSSFRRRLVVRDVSLLPELVEFSSEPPRLEGKRIHLKQPWRLLCELNKKPGPFTSAHEKFEAVGIENLEDIRTRAEDWAGITVSLSSAEPERIPELESIVRWFAAGTTSASVPLTFQVSAEGKGNSGVARLADRLGAPRVVPSRTLVSRLNRMEGVNHAAVIPLQEPLFADPTKNHDEGDEDRK